ncbi:MAG: helical backbone metal receptor [Candidatus Bathyarchaeota archaeon]|nr:helical backbone metal receptor [Candidatus Termiticorpusculum sp.]
MNNKVILAVILIVAIASASFYIVYNEFYEHKQTSISYLSPLQTPVQTPVVSTDSASYYPITVIDDDGTLVIIKSAPKSIVSLAPSSTEILFAVGAGDQVVGVTDFCNYPYNFKAWVIAGNMSSIGGYWHPVVASIIAVNPDLVIAYGDGVSDDAAVELRELGYTVLVLNPKNTQDILNDISLIGKATGHSDEAAVTIDNIQVRINAVTDKVVGITDKPKVCYLTLGRYVACANSFISDCITLAGGINVFDDVAGQYPVVSDAAVVAKNPDVIISSTSVVSLSVRADWNNINAIKNNQVYRPSNGDIYERSGPRFIDVVEDIVHMLYPDLFM